MGVRLGRYLALGRQRLEPALTQAALGAQMGRTRITVHNWEAGKSTPSFADRLLLAALLHLDITQLNRLADLDTTDGPVEAVGAMPAITTTGLPLSARVWVQKFLAEITAGGATDGEVESARHVLAAPSLSSFLQGGSVRAARLSEGEVIQALEAIGEGAIRRVLRARGRRV